MVQMPPRPARSIAGSVASSETAYVPAIWGYVAAPEADGTIDGGASVGLVPDPGLVSEGGSPTRTRTTRATMMAAASRPTPGTSRRRLDRASTAPRFRSTFASICFASRRSSSRNRRSNAIVFLAKELCEPLSAAMKLNASGRFGAAQDHGDFTDRAILVVMQD